MGRREYQDFAFWDNYGTTAWWTQVFASHGLAGELILQRLVSVFGLKNPSELCSARIAAGIMTVQFGEANAAFVSREDMDDTFQWVKASPCMHALPVLSPLAFAVRGDNRDSNILDDATSLLVHPLCACRRVSRHWQRLAQSLTTSRSCPHRQQSSCDPSQGSPMQPSMKTTSRRHRPSAGPRWTFFNRRSLFVQAMPAGFPCPRNRLL